MSSLVVTIDGEPVPKGRARSAIMRKRDGTPFLRHYTPKETEAYEERVRTLAKIEANRTGWAPAEGARFRVLVHVFRTHEGKGGDADNYQKAALDACNGVAFPDDRYVRELAVVVRQDRARPRMRIEVIALGGGA
jgi:Holliday junction resolvase RusA-like endonuclease